MARKKASKKSTPPKKSPPKEEPNGAKHMLIFFSVCAIFGGAYCYKLFYGEVGGGKLVHQVGGLSLIITGVMIGISVFFNPGARRR